MAMQTEIRIDASGAYYELGQGRDSSGSGGAQKLQTAEISLNDCLACRWDFSLTHFPHLWLI